MTVSLKDVVREWHACDEFQCYMHRETGEVFPVMNEEAQKAEEPDPDGPDWLKEILPKIREVLSSDQYVPMPDQWEFDEYHVMEKFCWSVTSGRDSEALEDAIRGRGAFRRFKSLVFDLGLEDAWHRFRDEALEEMLGAWMDSEGIEYED